MTRSAGARGIVQAVLGPTNTGKTHLAIERMLAHSSGVIGFPLRLLARENYDRIAARVGRARVALITGEEKIVPPNAQYFVCTVEAMPGDVPADFLAVDEIQLCADPERGHVFTERLLHARGRVETLFLGSDSMAGMIRRLVPEVAIRTRPRLSTLLHVGRKKLTKLPRRSAVVAFSASEVYEAAELLRRQRGGAAVVLGALSPRTRNAQVAMYEAGEVDFLVATDAIGMGLNMDVDHVAFASLSKFDGRRRRPLAAHEAAQIAGRAGRHLNDGTFGVTGNSPDFDELMIEQIEQHRFDPVDAIVWRSRDLDFRSPRLLLRSLEAEPPLQGLVRQREGDDQTTLLHLIRDDGVARRADAPDRVRLLWEVCRIPDFRKIAPEQHAELVGRIYANLLDHDGHLPMDWALQALERLDRVDGDIDTITQRLAHVRSWSYIAHRGEWLADPRGLQDRARAIEDRLSDALHQTLLNRFVDSTQAAVGRRRKGGDQPMLAGVGKDGVVQVEGHPVGRMRGLSFQPDDPDGLKRARAVSGAARGAVQAHMPQILRALGEDAARHVRVEPPGTVHWRDVPVALLTPGASALEPRLKLLPNDLPDGAAKARAAEILTIAATGRIQAVLAPLFRLAEAAETAGPGPRGLAHLIAEGLGATRRTDAAPLITLLTEAERKALAKLGLRMGLEVVYLAPLLSGRAMRMKAMLILLGRSSAETPAPDLSGKAPSLVPAGALDGADWLRIGFLRLGDWALRLDQCEALSAQARKAASAGPFLLGADFAARAGLEAGLLPELLRGLGFVRAREDEAGLWLRRSHTRGAKGADKISAAGNPAAASRAGKASRPGPAPKPEHSPFARLKDWGKPG